MENHAKKPADQIREALKARGIKRSQVSVVHDHYSLGSTIHVRIKDPAVSQSIVEAIAKEQERIDRDNWGEILSGGNRFVDVEYTEQALSALVAEFLPTLATLKADGIAVPIRDGAFRAFRLPSTADYVHVIDRDGREIIYCHSPSAPCEYAGLFAARQLAAHVANQDGQKEAR